MEILNSIIYFFNTNLLPLFWCLILPSSYYLIINYFKKNNLFQNKSQYGTYQYELISHLIITTCCVIYLSISGIFLFYIYNDLIYSYKHIFIKNIHIENHILIPMFFYQFWNYINSLFIKDLNSIFLLLHHLFVVILCYYTMLPFMQYITIYFFGLIEISNIFLSWIELTDYIPDLKKYVYLDNFLNIFFILTFYSFRIFYWIYSSYYFFNNIKSLIINEFMLGQKLDYIFLTFVLVTAYIFLTILQFYWGKIILDNIIKKLI